MAGTQGIGVFGIDSKFASGSLVFYEKTVGRTATGDVLTIGTAAVKVGGTAQDVDFQVYGTGSLSAIIDIGAATLTLVGITSSTNKPLTISDATESTSTITGALIVSGGIANAKDTYLGDDLFLTSGAVINFNAGDITLTHSANDLALGGGTMTFNGNLILPANTDLTFTGTTGTNDIVLTNALADALSITDGAADILVVNTSTAGNVLTITGAINGNLAITSSGATAGIGYAAGAGGSATQLTNKGTGVTLDTITGIITMNNASLAADTTVAFVLTNSAIAITDAVIVLHESAGTIGAYSFGSTAAAGSATISVHNNTPGALGEAIVLRFVVIKSVNA